jgi:hypothetical protein
MLRSFLLKVNLADTLDAWVESDYQQGGGARSPAILVQRPVFWPFSK